MTAKASSQAILPTHRVLSACLVMGEPRLEDILSEPIVLLRMKAAGVTAPEVRALCQRTRERLASALVTASPRGGAERAH